MRRLSDQPHGERPGVLAAMSLFPVLGFMGVLDGCLLTVASSCTTESAVSASSRRDRTPQSTCISTTVTPAVWLHCYKSSLEFRNCLL